jgi:hypothetical protein
LIERLLKVTKNGDGPSDISDFKGRLVVKPLNVWPLLALLVIIVLLVIWLRPHG